MVEKFSYDSAEGRMGGTREPAEFRDAREIQFSTDRDRYESAEGNRFLEAVPWQGMEEMFEEKAKRIDWGREEERRKEKELHIAPRKDVYFMRLTWVRAEAYPAQKIISFDFERITRAAKAMKVSEDLYALKTLLHEEVHIAAGHQTPESGSNNQNLRSGLSQRAPGQSEWFHWVAEGMNEHIAKRMMRDLVTDYGFKDYKPEDVDVFLSNVYERDQTGHEMAMAFIEGIVALFAHEFANPPGDREQVWNALERAHLRNTDLFAESYREISKAVLGEDKINTMAALTNLKNARSLLKLITDSPQIMTRLERIDQPLAERLKFMADSPYRDESGNEIIEL